MRTFRLPWFGAFVALVAGLCFSPAAAQSTAGLTGRVIDASTRQSLMGANVVLTAPGSSQMVAGAATGEDGTYKVEGVPPGRYLVEVSFVGFRPHTEEISLAAGETRTFDVSLEPTGFDLESVVVTASVRSEKVLDAPASVSVIDARELERAATLSPVSTLRNTLGVDMAQTGVDRHEVVLRGFNNAFSGATYVLADYRQGAIASLGVNAYNMMPLAPIDLERIEVVRGPGSALYGAGADAGVIHFLSKDPFTYPGTTVSAGGGTPGLFMGALRHAGVVGEKLGYKVVGQYTRAEEWHFDADDPLDKIQLESFRPEALPVDYDNWKYNATGMLQYRFRPDVSLTANVGIASAKSLFLSGIGTLQSEGFGYSFGQLRFQAGGFFAQAYVNQNDTGDSFVYRRGAVEKVTDYSQFVTAQAQYQFGLIQDRMQVVVGTDYELTLPDTEGTINGRNEEDDTITEIGSYLQATTAISPKLDLTFALRGDYNNVVEALQLSPRAAVVLKPAAGHSFRATYNRAFSSPGTNSLFLDINAGAAGPLTIQARGAAQGYTFRRDPATGGLVASSLIGSIFGNPVPAGLPLAVVYGGVYDALAAIPASQLRAVLAQQGIQLTEQEVAGLVQLLSPQGGTVVQGYTPGQLGYLNLSTRKIDRIVDDVTDIRSLEQTVSQNFEIGYKGVFSRRVLFAVDGYYTRKRDFIGPLAVESPFVLAPAPSAVTEDLRAALADAIAANPQLAAVLASFDISSEAAAALITQLAAATLQSSLPVQGSPIGIVQPVENAVPGQLLLTYRNYGQVAWYGVDAAVQVIASDRLNLFANASWVNDNYFKAEELGEDGGDLVLSMNAPKIKVRTGFDYAVPLSFNVNASLRHSGSFLVNSGPYIGEIDAYTLLDLGGGYDLAGLTAGLRLDVAVLNVLGTMHREFIGAPEIGRMATAQLTYKF